MGTLLCPVYQGHSSATPFGLRRWSATPFPSCPYWLAPQQWPEPSASTAQVWRSPASMACTPVSLTTATGLLLLAVLPVPSWPQWLLPQQEAVPLTMAQLCDE